MIVCSLKGSAQVNFAAKFMKPLHCLEITQATLREITKHEMKICDRLISLTERNSFFDNSVPELS